MTTYRAPSSLNASDVCPHCKRELLIVLIYRDGAIVEQPRCRDHGDVPPMRSAVVNGGSDGHG